MATNLHTPVHTRLCEPTVQQTLLLCAALQQGDAALAAWRAWRVNADLDQLPPGGFGLLPLLAYNLQRLTIVDPLLDKCQGIHRRTWTQNQLYLRQVATLLQTLQDDQITLLIEGEVLLALAYYPTLGARMFQQVQVVTPAEQERATQAVLAQAGWRPIPTAKAWLRKLVIGGTQPRHFQQTGSDLTLCWQQASPNTYPPLAADLWQRGQPLVINGVASQGVSPTDLFWMVCTQGIADLWRFGAVQWLVDATLLLRTGAVDWARLLEQVARQAFTLRLTAAVQGLQQWVDAPIPAEHLSTLMALPVHSFERWEQQYYQRYPSPIGKGGALWAAGQRHRWVRERERAGGGE